MTPREATAAAFACALGAWLFVAPWRPNPTSVPLAYDPGDEHVAQVDVSLWVYATHWKAFHPDRYFDAPILLPTPRPLLMIDWQGTEILLLGPLVRLRPPIEAWGIGLLLVLAAAAFASYVGGRWLTGSAWGGAAAAVLFGFGPLRAVHLLHLEYLFQPALALLPAAAAAHLDRPDRRRAAVLAALAALAAVEYLYTAFHLLVLLPPALLWGAWRRGRPLRTAVGPLLVAGALASLVLLPLGRTYFAWSAGTGLERDREEIDHLSADLAAWLADPAGRVLHIGEPILGVGDARLFPGLAALALSLAGLGRLRRRAPETFALGLLALLFTFGTLRLAAWRLGLPPLPGSPYDLLLDLFPPARGFRSPARAKDVAHLALALAGALAAADLARRGRRWRVALALLLGAAFLEARLGVRDFPLRPARADDPAYAWIAGRPEAGAVLDAPMGNVSTNEGHAREGLALHAALVHGRPTPNGTMGTDIPWQWSLATHLARPRPGETPAILRALGVRWVVVEGRDAPAWRAAGLRSAFASAGGREVLEVDAPLPIPATPAEFQERLFGLPHERVAGPGAPLAGAVEAPGRVEARAGRHLSFAAVVRNDGPETWCADGRLLGFGPAGDVLVGVRRWRGLGPGAEEAPADWRGRPLAGGGRLPFDVGPGETASVVVEAFAPRRAGRYLAEIDLVAEGIRWFRPADSPPAAAVEVVVR